MKYNLFLLCSVALACATGCGVTFSNLEKGAKIDDATTESIVVLGVQPKYRVGIARGTVKDGKVKIGAIGTLNVFPEDGYIVGKVPAATAPDEYHVQMILPEGIGAYVPAYSPCGNAQVASFSAPPGKVVYVGDITYAPDVGKLKVTYSSNFEAAKDFMTRHYPQLANSMEKTDIQTVPIVYVDCNAKQAPIPITIYIGR